MKFSEPSNAPQRNREDVDGKAKQKAHFFQQQMALNEMESLSPKEKFKRNIPATTTCEKEKITPQTSASEKAKFFLRQAEEERARAMAPKEKFRASSSAADLAASDHANPPRTSSSASEKAKFFLQQAEEKEKEAMTPREKFEKETGRCASASIVPSDDPSEKEGVSRPVEITVQTGGSEEAKEADADEGVPQPPIDTAEEALDLDRDLDTCVEQETTEEAVASEQDDEIADEPKDEFKYRSLTALSARGPPAMQAPPPPVSPVKKELDEGASEKQSSTPSNSSSHALLSRSVPSTVDMLSQNAAASSAFSSAQPLRPATAKSLPSGDSASTILSRQRARPANSDGDGDLNASTSLSSVSPVSSGRPEVVEEGAADRKSLRPSSVRMHTPLSKEEEKRLQAEEEERIRNGLKKNLLSCINELLSDIDLCVEVCCVSQVRHSC